MLLPQYVVPTETPTTHYPLNSAHAGLVPLCMMLVLAKLQGTVVQGFLAAGSVGQLAGMSAYSAGIVLHKAFDCGYVQRATSGGRSVYALSPAGFRWLQLWVKDIDTSWHAVAHLPQAPDSAVSLVMNASYTALCTGWVEAAQVVIGHEGPARPQLIVKLHQESAAVPSFCYAGHWTSHQLHTAKKATPRIAYNQHWWPVWSQELRLTQSVLNSRPG